MNPGEIPEAAERGKGKRDKTGKHPGPPDGHG
jgi:hypothetical protein